MITYDFGKSLTYKIFFIELIFMLYIPLDSEFEGLPYEGTLFFQFFVKIYARIRFWAKFVL